MKKNQLILGAIVLAALVAIVILGRDRIHFDFALFRAQLAEANWWKIAFGFACICVGYLFRSVRWALLIRPAKRVGPFSLLSTQVIGFTAIALIGRVADPVRPYLVSKKTGLPLSSQFAVYVVERLFDAGSMALIFSSVILLAPAGALPHPEIVRKAGYFAAATTLGGAVFLLTIRLAGGAVAGFFERTFAHLSKGLAHSIGSKIRTFQNGLDTLRSPKDFVVALTLSLAMWGLIALSYLVTAQAFTASPQLASMTFTRCILLMAFSGAASSVQLPIIGWFTQIGLVAAAMSSFYGVSTESATACAATLLFVTFLGIVPIGLVWAQFEHVSLRKVTVESEVASEHAEDQLENAAEE